MGQIQNVFLIVIPATILFAWIFFWFCERPFITRKPTTGLRQSSVEKSHEPISLLVNAIEPQVSAALNNRLTPEA